MQQPHPGSEQIGALVFRCPTTGHEIRSEIWTDKSTLLRIEHSTVQRFCQACRTRHEFLIANSGAKFPNNDPPGSERPIRLFKVCEEVS